MRDTGEVHDTDVVGRADSEVDEMYLPHSVGGKLNRQSRRTIYL